jgi:hypothetical protein
MAAGGRARGDSRQALPGVFQNARARVMGSYHQALPGIANTRARHGVMQPLAIDTTLADSAQIYASKLSLLATAANATAYATLAPCWSRAAALPSLMRAEQC